MTEAYNECWNGKKRKHQCHTISTKLRNLDSTKCNRSMDSGQIEDQCVMKYEQLAKLGEVTFTQFHSHSMFIRAAIIPHVTKSALRMLQ